MANKFLTMQSIARQALPILVDNLVFPNLIYQDYSQEFAGKGDTIQIKKPPVFQANDFDEDNGVEVQDINTGKVSITLDKLADVSVEVTSKQLALEAAEFRQQVTEPMAVALAEKINREGLDLYQDIPYFSGTSGTTPGALQDISNIRKGLNKRKVPMSNRQAVWDVDADAKFTTLDALVNVDKAGTPMALREGSIGRVYGINNYYSQAVSVHEAGTATGATDPKVNGAVTKGQNIINIDATAMTGKLVKGDLLTIGTYQHVVTADTTEASGNAIAAVNIYPSLQEDISDDTPITFIDKTAGAHVANIGFHKNAFAFVTRSLELPRDKEAYTVSYNGITLRVVYGYDMKFKKNMMSMDVLYGFKTIYAELAEIILG
ncbi:P22 phage major capsid protein family protein [Vallitalea maricola]|uniref:Uncharacterized protein n=1 Tax=Vallitalea maricola TaxID=3074433 RepID=A0ACB5UF81_9FIRM|nr:hypothetical protein AN2V17_04220 [Vallitalea sp. AN17-2]